MLLTGWHGEMPLVDPMCGSGTLCIEAAWIALNRPPGLTRRRFGFMGWMNYDVACGRPCATKRAGKSPSNCRSRSWASMSAAMQSISPRATPSAAGIGHLLQFARRDLDAFKPPDGPPGILLCNPPYGERIGEEKELVGLYRALGEVYPRTLPRLATMGLHRQRLFSSADRSEGGPGVRSLQRQDSVPAVAVRMSILV